MSAIHLLVVVALVAAPQGDAAGLPPQSPQGNAAGLLPQSPQEDAAGGSSCHGGGQGNYWPAIEAYLEGPPQDHWTEADCELVAPVWTGDDAKGQLFTPLWNGVGAGMEDWVTPAPGGDCEAVKGTLRLDWDEAQDRVEFTIKGVNIPVSPAVTRIDGGDPEDPASFIPPPQATWWYNAFHRAPKDFPIEPGDGTAYRLWTIFTTFNTVQATFYYDAGTLLLLGSAFDFPQGPPANAIPVGLPVAVLTASALMYPDSRGFLLHRYTIPYHQVTTEGGYYSWVPVTFVPHNLCRALPYQPVLGQLRPYVTPWRPPEEGQSWDSLLSQGLSFDITIEEGRPDVPPGGDDQNNDYVYSGFAFLQNTPAIPGGIPLGWHISQLAGIQNVQPGIFAVPRCTGFISNPRVTAPMFCQTQN